MSVLQLPRRADRQRNYGYIRLNSVQEFLVVAVPPNSLHAMSDTLGEQGALRASDDLHHDTHIHNLFNMLHSESIT